MFSVETEQRPGYLAVDVITDIFEGTYIFRFLSLSSLFRVVLQRQYYSIYVRYLTANCFCLISAARKPSVAAIDGLAIGGGLEIAMVFEASN